MCRSADDPRMQVCLLKSKIHRATITDGNLKYEGSLTIATDLMESSTVSVNLEAISSEDSQDLSGVQGRPAQPARCVAA